MALDGKTALVTGAGRGIGHAYCEQLAADGAHVVAVDINDPADSLRSLPGQDEKVGLVCDISQPGQIAAAADTVLQRFGRCDILVNNAAIFPAADLGGMTIERWRRVQAVNVEAALLALQTIKRPSVPADLGHALGFLVSDQADFITGQILHVDGGVTRTGA